MEAKLTEGQWQAVDKALLNREKLVAFDLIYQWAGVSFGEAQRIFYDRYAYLKQVDPDYFGCTDEEYWEGWYS